MLKYRLSSLMLASILGLTACGGDDDQTSNTNAPINRTFAVFSPATSELPIPNDLLFAAQSPADGTMSAGVDPANPVVTGIDSLDGNSVISPFDIRFSSSLNTAQNLNAANFVAANGAVIPNPNQNVFLLPLTYPSGDGLSQASINGSSVEVPTFAEAVTYQTAAATSDAATLGALAMPTARAELISQDGGNNNTLRITPLKPLMPKTKYLVVVTDVEDLNGNPVTASSSYELLRDPSNDLSIFGAESTASLTGVRNAILGWERLAAGYFGFMQTVFTAAGVTTANVPSADDIIFSITFTTGGTTDVLQSVAAPEYFFEQSLRTGVKKDAIIKLVDGTYTLSGMPSTASPTPVDTAINGTLNTLLTAQMLPGGQPNPLFNATIAGAIASGADYATIAQDATAAHIMQQAAAQAAIAVNDGSVPAVDNVSIANEAQGTVQAIVAGISSQVGSPLETSDVFPLPAPRVSNFFRMDNANAINPALATAAVIYQGEITLPYYLGRPEDSDLSPIVTDSWVANATIGAAIDSTGATPPSSQITYRYPFPTKQSDVTVPVVVTVPNDANPSLTKPAAGWPVVIFVHGITTDRSASLPIANALAAACLARDANGMATGDIIPGVPCFATIAIDQPLHGIAPAGSTVPGLMSVTDPDAMITANVGDNMPSAMLTERHFDVTAGADGRTPTAMDYAADTGSSGSLFINLTNFVNGRDNLRQMSIDLLNLNASLDTMDLNDDGTSDDFDPANVYFVGHSLGGINGLPFIAINNSAAVQNSAFISSKPMVKAAAALVSGGGTTRLLANSQNFAPTILQGLAAANESLVQGMSGLESYFNIFQGLLDSADVINFASSLSDANASTGILLTEVIGDRTIPNAADESLGTGPLNTAVADTGFVINGFPAPLSGTEPLIAQFGAIRSDSIPAAADSDGDPEVLVSRFTAGSHGTPVSADDPAAFVEMVSQIVAFFARDGIVTDTIVTNPDVIEDMDEDEG